jgi:hypothetical protein
MNIWLFASWLKEASIYAKTMTMPMKSSRERRKEHSTLFVRREVYKVLMIKTANQADNRKRK